MKSARGARFTRTFDDFSVFRAAAEFEAAPAVAQSPTHPVA
jgi:hypothetical protein